MRRAASVLVTLGAVVLVVGVGGRRVWQALGGLGPAAVTVALGLGLVTTAAAALRWWVLARRLGLALTPGAALARCYEAQFLNLALPGGVLGDARRGIGHGREHGGGDGTVRAVGAVVLERSVGQAVLVTTALVASAVVPGSPRATGTAVVVALAVAVALGSLLVVVLRAADDRLVGPRRVVVDVIRAVLDPRAGPVAVGCSLVVVAGLVGVFVLSAHAAGVVAGPAELVGQALVALLAMAVPLGLAGWGPREAATATAFAAAGLGAGPGVATAAVYGVLTLVAALPGGALLLVGRLRGTARRERAGVDAPSAEPLPAVTVPAPRRPATASPRPTGAPSAAS